MFNIGYALFFPIHLWFWQFLLTPRAPLPGRYIPNAIFQVVFSGIAPLIWFCFRCPFGPWLTAGFLAYVVSLLLQYFSYIYWSYGSTTNFTIPLSHLDSFYFALGTLSTAGSGNISAISALSRGLQSWQMGLDLVLIGFVAALILARYATLFDRPRTTESGDDAQTKLLTLVEANLKLVSAVTEKLVGQQQPATAEPADQATGTDLPADEIPGPSGNTETEVSASELTG
jgi:hypothetical protein